MHEFLAREKLMQAKLMLMKLCTSPFVNIHASEILSMCNPRRGLYLKLCASEIRASQGPPVDIFNQIGVHFDSKAKFFHLILQDPN